MDEITIKIICLPEVSQIVIENNMMNIKNRDCQIETNKSQIIADIMIARCADLLMMEKEELMLEHLKTF